MTGNKHPFSFQSRSAVILIAAQIVIREFSVLLHHCQNAFHGSAQQPKFATAQLFCSAS